VYADEGTAAHTLAAWCLTQDRQADEFIGTTIHVYEDDGSTVRRSFVCDPDMSEHVQTYVDAMRRLPGVKLYEQRVDFSEFVGVGGSKGTSDTIGLDEDTLTLHSHDFKFGKGVKVDASWADDDGNEHPNEQPGMYLLGTLSDNDLIADWETFVMGIHQPRIGSDGHVSEFTMTRSELMAFAQSARAAAAEAMSGFANYAPDGDMSKLVPLPIEVLHERGMLRPGQKQCRFCPAGDAGGCPALAGEVKSYVFTPRKASDSDFGAPPEPVDPATVPLVEIPLPGVLELIEMYVSGMRSRIQRELQAGKKVKGWKLTAGKKGPRQWVSDKLAGAEAVMKKLLKKGAYTEPKLLSPTQAEAALKKLKKGAEYEKLKEYVTQSEGGEHVAPDTDPGEPIEKQAVDMLLDSDGDLL
jgi:hypothetical protein